MLKDVLCVKTVHFCTVSWVNHVLYHFKASPHKRIGTDVCPAILFVLHADTENHITTVSIVQYQVSIFVLVFWLPVYRKEQATYEIHNMTHTRARARALIVPKYAAKKSDSFCWERQDMPKAVIYTFFTSFSATLVEPTRLNEWKGHELSKAYLDNFVYITFLQRSSSSAFCYFLKELTVSNVFCPTVRRHENKGTLSYVRFTSWVRQSRAVWSYP